MYVDHELSDADCSSVQKDFDSVSNGGEMLQKVRDIIALSESSSTASDDDKPSKLSDMSSCPTSEKPYYFSARSTGGVVTKQYGREVL